MASDIENIYLLKIWSLGKIYAIIYIQEHFASESSKGKKRMYLTVKQQVKHLSKEDYLTIKELCHTAKNLVNEAIYVSITLQKVNFSNTRRIMSF